MRGLEIILYALVQQGAFSNNRFIPHSKCLMIFTTLYFIPLCNASLFSVVATVTGALFQCLLFVTLPAPA